MKIVQQKIEPMGIMFLDEKDLLSHIGRIAGECYNSSMDTDKCIKRALNCVQRGHHSPWEHYNITLKCLVDRGVSHALVRHRHCAFQQSSTIYQKYDDIQIVDIDGMTEQEREAYWEIEKVYRGALESGKPAGAARDVLPNALATNLIITTNIRQWMYMIHRRNGPGDTERMHIWCQQVRNWFEDTYPLTVKAFDDWYESHPL